jgi:hypothetical protein
VRYIGGYADYSFIGYLKEWPNVQQGTGMYYKNQGLEYSGYYNDGDLYYNKP